MNHTIKKQKMPEKQVTFYPGYGYRENNRWIVPMRLWVREKPDFPLRSVAWLARKVLRNKAGLDELNTSQKALYKKRIEPFIADRESREQVLFSFDNDPDEETFQLRDAQGYTRTDWNGLLEGQISLSEKKAQSLLQAQHSQQGWLTFSVVSKKHWGWGKVRLIPSYGTSVISDIDDTIKVTEITKGSRVVIYNTFFKEFTATQGMPDMYQSMGREVAFHYVSGAPWQLYGALAEFMFENEGLYPQGSIHMKNVRTSIFESESYTDFKKLLVDGSRQTTFNQKVKQMTTILEHFPRRQFILIGDSGERDPEVFDHIRKRHPGQIKEIRIRDVLNDPYASRLQGMTVIKA